MKSNGNITIKGLQRKMLTALKAVKGFEEYDESAWCMQGDKVLYGRHVSVGLSVVQPSRKTQNQIVRIFRKYYYSRARRLHHTRGMSYQGNSKVKSELVILL